MTRKLTRLCGILFLCVLTALVTLFGQGYFRYRRETEALPVEKAVEAYTKEEDYVPYDQIDEDFVHAVISVEDKRFFTRKGYDLIALGRAIWHDLRAGDIVEGGSTISEQIAKNLYLGGYVNGLEEKIAGFFLLYDLEFRFSKQELFALYVNMNWYGDSYQGIHQAAKGYYNASPSDLTLGQAAILAGIPNAPAIYQLSDGYGKAKRRQERVLERMMDEGYITETEKEKALMEDVQPIMKKP